MKKKKKHTHHKRALLNRISKYCEIQHNSFSISFYFNDPQRHLMRFLYLIMHYVSLKTFTYGLIRTAMECESFFFLFIRFEEK